MYNIHFRKYTRYFVLTCSCFVLHDKNILFFNAFLLTLLHISFSFILFFFLLIYYINTIIFLCVDSINLNCVTIFASDFYMCVKFYYIPILFIAKVHFCIQFIQNPNNDWLSYTKLAIQKAWKLLRTDNDLNMRLKELLSAISWLLKLNILRVYVYEKLCKK